MKKFLLMSLLIFCLAVPLVFSSQTYVIKVKVQMANARMEPDANSSVIKQIPNGTLLEAKSRLGDWYEIIITDSTGNSVSAYINAMVVDLISGQEQQPVRQPQPVRQAQPQRTQTDMTPASLVFTDDYGAGGMKILGGLALGNITFSELPPDALVDPGDYKKFRMGFFGGLGYESGGRMGFEIDVLYMQKGVKFKGSYVDASSGIDVDFDATLKVDALTVPALLKFRFKPGSTPYLLVGGEVSYILSAKVAYDVTNNISSDSTAGTEDVKDNIKEIDYGLVLGGGFEMNAGSLPLIFEARYHLGLANMINVDSDDVQESDSVKSNVIVAMVGFRF